MRLQRPLSERSPDVDPVAAASVGDTGAVSEPVRPEIEGWVAPTWEQVVREHSARVYRLAYRLSGNPQDAEDLTQETFVRVFRSVAEYTPGTFEGWLHRITTNLFLDLVRRRQRIRFDALPEDAGDRLQSREAGPEQAYDQRGICGFSFGAGCSEGNSTFSLFGQDTRKTRGERAS